MALTGVVKKYDTAKALRATESMRHDFPTRPHTHKCVRRASDSSFPLEPARTCCHRCKCQHSLHVLLRKYLQTACQDLFVLRTDVIGGTLQAGDKAGMVLPACPGLCVALF